MSVKSFKFVSPGVFINEIDNSFIPKSADAIGPVVIGRAQRGLAMTPVKVESYSQFVQMFGDTVPGNAGGDIWRNGNYQSPMYGTYAAKAFLRANVAPLTYVRLLGQQNTNATTAGQAGWETTKDVGATLGVNGGAYGLWVWKSSSAQAATGQMGTGTLAAIWYVDTSGGVALSGTMIGGSGYAAQTASVGAVIGSDTSGLFTLLVTGSGTSEKVTFGFDDSQETFVRKVFNTNPQLASDAGTFYPAASYKNYWLGQSYEQSLRSGRPPGTVAATSSVVFGNTGGGGKGSTLTASVLTLVDAAGTVKTYTMAATIVPTTTATGPKVLATGSVTVLATALAAAINGSDGHNGTITATVDTGTVNMTQATLGAFGNNQRTTRTTAAEANLSSSGGFTGGKDSSETNLIGGGSTLVGTPLYGVVLPVALSSDVTKGPHNLKGISSIEAKAGWFVGQDMGASGAGSATYTGLQKLFRLVGRGHGEWLPNNVKVSIEKIRQSNSSVSDYGSFSVVLRQLRDTDSNVIVLERYDNCNLDPASPNYVARKIGDKYVSWDTTNRLLKTYGEYANQSKFVYVEMDAAVDAGASGLETLLPFGYYGPPKPKYVNQWTGLTDPSTFITGAANQFLGVPTADANLTSSNIHGCTLNLQWPVTRLRHSASDGGLSDQTNAYFGFSSTREVSSTRAGNSVAAPQRLWYGGQAGDPIAGATGFDGYAYIFTMDDVMKSTATSVYFYSSGSRGSGVSVSAGGNYKTLIDAGYDRFTAPFFGAFDGFDITNPDPLYNNSMTAGSSTELNSYVYNTYKRAIDTIADPEVVDMNLLVTPGLTFDALTTHMVNVCSERADALALIDLASVYVPPHEKYESSKADRLASTPTNAANDLKARRIDSSYGATFYPWVQTRDEQTGRMLWIPPSIAMAGVLASSQAKSDVWFAPAGFNRGGLTDGAAGIPVTGVTTRLTSKQRDILYEARINPIASFPSSGIVVFGQKTLQERQSALDRINVRRLVIYLKKQISVLSTQVLFEQNVQATWNRFKSLIEPFLANVKVQFGITDYKLILDESTTTPDLIDQNILYAKIMIKPARAIEYIAIDFVVASTGASFDD